MCHFYAFEAEAGGVLTWRFGEVRLAQNTLHFPGKRGPEAALRGLGLLV